jgi:hypothetical protein
MKTLQKFTKIYLFLVQGQQKMAFESSIAAFSQKRRRYQLKAQKPKGLNNILHTSYFTNYFPSKSC